MLQFAKSLFVVYATRNKRMPDFKCAIIVLVNKNKKKNSSGGASSVRNVRYIWPREKIPVSSRAEFILRDWINRVIELSTQKFAGASRITLVKCAWNNFDVHFKTWRICSIINMANGLCSLQRQIFGIIKTRFNILQLQSGNTTVLHQCTQWKGGGQKWGRMHWCRKR